jgi:hypothetical protein
MTEAERIMREVFREACALIDAWVARMCGWDDLPARFDISSERWVEAEVEITKAANAGDVARVRELGDAFIERVRNYLAQWEVRMTEKQAKGATV